jgi:hypothetical protein
VVHHYFNDRVNPERKEFYCHITPFTNPFDGCGVPTLNYFADKHKAMGQTASNYLRKGSCLVKNAWSGVFPRFFRHTNPQFHN